MIRIFRLKSRAPRRMSCNVGQHLSPHMMRDIGVDACRDRRPIPAQLLW